MIRLAQLRYLAVLAMALLSPQAHATDQFITVASTTSTEQSGLFDFLLPRFTADTGITVHVVVVGTGQALQIGQRGDADALLVHDRVGEEAFVAGGYGIDRRDVMANDFILVGPQDDPARVKGNSDIVAAFGQIAAVKAPFASRGDDSGTNRMELRLWKVAAIDPKAASGSWYRELGSGMGPTLNTAASMGAYVLTDRATWANFRNRQTLTILVEGDKRLLNPYSSILVNPQRFPSVKAAPARVWHDWLTGPAGRSAITAFKINGEQLFFLDRQ